MIHGRILFCMLVGVPMAFAETGQIKEFHRIVPLDAKGQLSLETFKGTVDVKTSEAAEIRVDARIEADSGCGTAEEQRDWVNKTEVSVEGSSSSVRIATDYSKIGEFEGREGCQSRPFVNYQITMPRAASLSLRDHKSVVNISDVRGDLSIKTHKGKVNVSNIQGSFELETHKGQAKLAFEKLVARNSVRSFKGDIDILVPRNAAFTLDAKLGRRGELDSSFVKTQTQDRADRRRSRTVSGEINGGGPILRLSSEKGRFRLHEA